MIVHKLTEKRFLIRLIFILLALFPLFFPQSFYEHFYAYLTGTIINYIVQAQWPLVMLSIIFFTLFLIPLSYRKKARWIDYSLAGAFFVSLFIEMYGIPLTILFASKYFFTAGTTLPANVIEFNFLGVGLGMDLAMVYGTVLMVLGMALIIAGWWSLYWQSKHQGFAHSGIYSFSRNPQYVGFILLIIGWFFGWPTILTLIFSPILIHKYIKAASAEEKEMAKVYGEPYETYQKTTPFLI